MVSEVTVSTERYSRQFTGARDVYYFFTIRTVIGKEKYAENVLGCNNMARLESFSLVPCVVPFMLSLL